MPRPAPHEVKAEQDVERELAALEAAASVKAPDPGAGAALFSRIVAVLWVLGASVAAAALIGLENLALLEPVQGAALGAAIILPAIMVWFAGSAARDGARARAEARRLADAADRLMNPEQSAELAAKRLAVTVRGEITALDKAIEQTLARLKEVEGAVDRQARAVDDMSNQAKAGAGHMISGMEREREELLRISKDLTAQAQAIGESISRHTRGVSDVAHKAEQEVRAANQALDHRITSFGAAAALITDRTHALTGAAQVSADSALRLETALSNALDILAKATSLTDAARASADDATLAANTAAGAVRDTTQRAIDDAKRAAEVIRGEAVNVERDAAIALERLREAADAAREAAVGARAAAETIERAPPQRTRHAEVRHEPRAPEPQEYEPPPAYAPPPRRAQEPASRRGEESMFGEPQPAAPMQGGWTWRELLSGVDEAAPSEPQPPADRRRSPGDEAARYAPAESRTGTLPISEMIDHAGLRVNEVFSASGLDRIAQRARSGTQARRRAVKDAASDAVRILAEHLARDGRANQEAMAFLRSDGARIAELLSRGRAAMNAESTRVFLLIDAAAG